MDVERALDELAAALSGAGVPLWDPPESFVGLEELEAALAPMRLPDDVREFWRRVDVRTLRATPYVRFIEPELALQFRRTVRPEAAAFQPLTLVEVGYESHVCMSVELDVEGTPGGALFEWAVDDVSASGFTRRFNRLADWLRYVAVLIDRGWYLRQHGSRGPWLLVPGPEHAQAERAARPVPAPHPVHGATLHVPGDIVDWPGHWQRANGLRPEDMRLRGATHTVAQVLASPPNDELRATITGRVIALAGAAWARVRVDDGTAALDVFCPSETTLLGPRVGHWYEFDIVVAAGPRHVPVDPKAAVAGIDDPAEQVTAVLMARHGGLVGATAEAVRCMSAPQ